MNMVKRFTLVLMSVWLFGCASGAKIENMVYTAPEGSQYDAGLEKNVQVQPVSGGEETNPLWTSEISSDAFQKAIEQSLEGAGLLGNAGRYKLSAQLIGVDQPMFGINFEVTTKVKYSLIDTQSGAVVMDELVEASHTATIGDAFVAVTRLRLANEGAGKKNIEGLLQKLSQLRIDPKQVSLRN